MPKSSIQLNSGETILYSSQPSRRWYAIAWKVVIGLIEVIIFFVFSVTALTTLLNALLSTFLPSGIADLMSKITFQGIAPFLVAAWFVEDTARIFTSELVLTSQRFWSRGSPYAWTPAREIPLSGIKSISFRREAIFIHLTTTKKPQVHMAADAKQIVKAFEQYTGKAGTY